jgi:hypothetical protein
MVINREVSRVFSAGFYRRQQTSDGIENRAEIPMAIATVRWLSAENISASWMAGHPVRFCTKQPKYVLYFSGWECE